MISLYPTFYHTFQCKANHCEHTCCQKWTIDIDEDTAQFYDALQTPLGDELRRAITIDEEGHHFVFSDEQPTCALLNEDGLCRVVLTLGEDGLCETCHMHPRFYKYIEDLELCGVGLSCEASVAALMDGESSHLRFTIEDNDGEFTEDDQPVLENIFQLLALDVDPSLCQFAPIIDADYYDNVVSTYNKTEPIDEQWTLQMQTLLHYIQLYKDSTASLENNAHGSEIIGVTTEDVIDSTITEESNIGAALTSFMNDNATSLNKLYQYILYRQIDMLADYSLEALVGYATDATHFIALSAIRFGDLPEQIRRWSEQIEYDEDNVALLFTLQQ